ncbi:probable membrane-associated kinase regulator 6 [Neltuma alba]|uniref:probable membrane-associated kinase regulator 6 n=1 Tax=Neltuma alba TaxID=207710 RepID=UPI0010A3EE3B|nr:probable membrane-associated kinase regulator 6 [Prosopis alba]
MPLGSYMYVTAHGRRKVLPLFNNEATFGKPTLPGNLRQSGGIEMYGYGIGYESRASGEVTGNLKCTALQPQLDDDDEKARFNNGETQSFNFDFSVTLSPSAGFAHADELFSDGFIRPVYGNTSKIRSCNTPDSTQTMPSSFFYSGIVSPRGVGTHHHGFFTKWRKSTQKILRSTFGYFKQLGRRVGCSRESTRVGDFEKTEWEVNSWSISQQASPVSVKDYSMGDLFDHENSIHEAVLHCKRSIGK